jgi:transcriptional regulator with XRE-family HTH domain
VIDRHHLQTQGAQHSAERLPGHVALPALEPAEVGDLDPSGLRDLRELLALPLSFCASDEVDGDSFGHPDSLAMCLPGILACASETCNLDVMESVIQTLARARATLGLTQAEVGQATGVGPTYISRLEGGGRGNPTLSVLEGWADKLGHRLAAVPREAAAPIEVTALDPALRDLVLRLARILPAAAAADPRNVRSLRNLIRDYEEDLGGSDVPSASSQDSRAKTS